MEKLRAVFQSFKDFGLERDNMKVIIAYLENTNAEFRAVAYEAVSMALALKDLKKGNTLELWRPFMEVPAGAYISQVHVGLGWAIAQENKSYDILSSIEYLMRSRVFDGCGYYDGTFRSRQTIKNKKLPENLNEANLHYYDQGLGRSIWYKCLGDPALVSEMIGSFQSSRHPDLWRGIGIASAYVGGFDEKMLNDLFSIAAAHQKQLATGTALAARGRIMSNTVTPDMELVCRLWWNLSAKDITSITEELLPLMNAENIYDIWMEAIEKRFVIQSDQK